MKRSVGTVALVLAALATGCQPALWEDLQVRAPKSTLRIGESVQLSVERKLGWFRANIVEPSRVSYFTTSESTLVVESDGRATCVGTHGRPLESAWITVSSGKRVGRLTLELLPDGPGPTLEVVAESTELLPVDARSQWTPCCSEPLALTEGHQLKFAVREPSSGRDLTSAATGTIYTLFYGSGVPNDPQPSIVTGSVDGASAKNFRLDSERGIVTAPESIGRWNRARVIVFVRNRELVGWREIVIIHPGGKLATNRTAENDLKPQVR
jgi:hypothetical protein